MEYKKIGCAKIVMLWKDPKLNMHTEDASFVWHLHTDLSAN